MAEENRLDFLMCILRNLLVCTVLKKLVHTVIFGLVLHHAATQVKPLVLNLYEKYFLPLGENLVPCLCAFLIGLWPGLEEAKSDSYKQTQAILDKVCSIVGEQQFFRAYWKAILLTGDGHLKVALLL